MNDMQIKVYFLFMMIWILELQILKISENHESIIFVLNKFRVSIFVIILNTSSFLKSKLTLNVITLFYLSICFGYKSKHRDMKLPKHLWFYNNYIIHYYAFLK